MFFFGFIPFVLELGVLFAARNWFRTFNYIQDQQEDERKRLMKLQHFKDAYLQRKQEDQMAFNERLGMSPEKRMRMQDPANDDLNKKRTLNETWMNTMN